MNLPLMLASLPRDLPYLLRRTAAPAVPFCRTQYIVMLLRCGLLGAVTLSVAVVLASPAYVLIYRVSPQVRLLAREIMLAYAFIAPVKVLNMISGGVLRSGGQTKYLLVINSVGTRGFGVPLGLIAAFVRKLSSPYVYFILSLEECVRLTLALALFHHRSWMHSLEANQG